jgi:hypothetical protein
VCNFRPPYLCNLRPPATFNERIDASVRMGADVGDTDVLQQPIASQKQLSYQLRFEHHRVSSTGA